MQYLTSLDWSTRLICLTFFSYVLVYGMSISTSPVKSTVALNRYDTTQINTCVLYIHDYTILNFWCTMVCSLLHCWEGVSCLFLAALLHKRGHVCSALPSIICISLLESKDFKIIQNAWVQSYSFCYNTMVNFWRAMVCKELIRCARHMTSLLTHFTSCVINKMNGRDQHMSGHFWVYGTWFASLL